MAWWMESDTFATNPAWGVLAGGRPAMVDALQAAYARIKATVAHLMDDGFLTTATAVEQCRGRRPLLDKLCTPVLGKPPMLHRAGDECPCIPGGVWVDGYDLYIHDYLRKNPARRERDRKRAQDADRRNHALRAEVYRRDGGCCRYCLSGPLSPKSGRAKDLRKRLEFDHVDPDQPALDGTNYVVACKRCNSEKGERTPEEADLVLLPPPTPQQAAAWQARGLALFDPTDHAPNHEPITPQPRTNHDPDHEHDHEHDRDPDREQTAAQAASPRPETTANTVTEQGKHEPAVWGLGRGGHRDVNNQHGPPGAVTDQPARSQDYPDIYHGRARRPAPPPPDYQWPPGAVPANQRPPTQEDP
jgi:5-methylcytosine-specific restriction endonuclease McrA